MGRDLVKPVLVEGILSVDMNWGSKVLPGQIDIVKCIKKGLSSPDRAATC